MRNKWLLLITAILIFNGLWLSSSWAQAPVKVLVLPMQINAEKDLSYLAKGIQDMLTSRLTDEGKVMPLGRDATQQAMQKVKAPLTPETALDLARQVAADYVAFGSVTVFGESISTDAKFADTASGKVLVTFSQFGKDQGDVIFHVNLFASQVNETVFGRKTISYESPKSGPGADGRQHPDKLWTGAQKGGEYVAETPGSAGQTVFNLWKSRRFSTQITGLSVGDVDGDKQNELVFINKHEIYIHRINQKRLERVALVQYPKHYTFLSVDVTDANHNGIAEIFITNYNRIAHQIASFVLEWRDGKFRPLVQNAPWHFKVVTLGDQGAQLLGQKMGQTRMFEGPVELMKWDNGTYVRAGFQPLPRSVNAYGVAMGRLNEDTEDSIISLRENGLVAILRSNGSLEWESDDYYGGSSVYIDFPDATASEEDARTYSAHSRTLADQPWVERIYVPQRVHIADIDEDGLKEVLLVNNQYVGAGRLVNKLRVFKNGRVECLAMTKLGLQPKWRTQKVSGHISDYVVGDFDNDGRQDLVLSVIRKSNTLGLGKDRSYLVSWSVKPQEKPEDKSSQ